MGEHMNRLLGSYLDGELKGDMLSKFERHLAGCSSCQGALGELKRLSKLLKMSANEKRLTPDARFSAQVALKLTQRQAPPLTSKAAQIGWWLIPALILSTWVFLQAVLVVSSLAAAAGQAGLLTGPLAWVSNLTEQNLVTSAVFNLVDGRFGLATSAFLDFIGEGTAFGLNLIVPVLFQTALGLLFASWLAVWWVLNISQRSK